MKKFTTSILAFLACAACLTGCLAPDDSSSTGGGNSGDNAAVTAAAAALKAKYDTELEDGRTDYEVSNVWGDYDVAWTVSFADGTNAVNLFDEGDFTTVEINKLLASDVDYTLKATLTAADGTSASTNIVRTAFAIDQNISVPISEAPVPETAYKMHLYQTNLSKSLYLTGGMSSYYYATTSDIEQAADVYVESTTDGFYMYKMDGSSKSYLNIVKNDTHNNVKYQSSASSVWVWDAEFGTMTTDLSGTVFFLGTYASNSSFSACDKVKYPNNFKGCLTIVSDRNDASNLTRVDSTMHECTVDPVVVGEYTMKLPLLGEVYPEASIAWEVTKGAEAVSLNTRGNRLTTKTVTALTEVTLKATVTAGDVTKTKEITLNVAPNTVDGIFAATEKLSSGTYFANEVSLTGTVTTDLPVELSDKWPNLNESITIEVAEGKKINAYNLAGAGYDVIKPGYTVTVKGIITNYTKNDTSTIQFNRGCEIVSYAAPTADQTKVDVEKALFDMETTVTENGTVALPTAGTTYSDVAIAWSVVTEGTTGTYELAQDGKSITFTRSESAATVVNLKATFTCGEGTATKDFAMNLTKAGATTLTYVPTDLGALISPSGTNKYEDLKNHFTDGYIALDSNISFTADKGNGSSNPAYHQGNAEFRLYAGNTFTFKAATGKTITSIVLTLSEDKKFALSSTDATLSDVTTTSATITPNAGVNEITIQVGNVSGNQARITNIVIVYA